MFRGYFFFKCSENLVRIHNVMDSMMYWKILNKKNRLPFPGSKELVVESFSAIVIDKIQIHTKMVK